MATGLYALPPRGITVWALGAMALVRKLLRRRQFTLQAALSGLDEPPVLLLRQVSLLHRPVSQRTECKGRRPKTPLRLGCRPAGTSLMSLGVDYVVSKSLGWAFPNKVYATLEFRACRVTVVQPLQG